MKVIDNYLPTHEHERVKRAMSSGKFPWYLSSVVWPDEMECDQLDNMQFVHCFYDGSTNDKIDIEQFNSPLMKMFISKARPFNIIRIKANCHTRTSKIIEHGFHMDFVHPEMETAIYYVNTNDGYTRFEDGTKVESVANRMVLFPTMTMHGGTTCTDNQTRMVINFNWFPNIAHTFTQEQKDKGVYGHLPPTIT